MSKSTQGQLHNSWHNFSKYRPLIRELVTRDLKVKYRRSVLGYMWSILNPLLMMLLQTLVFSYMFRFDIPNFPLYLICGNTLFNFFNESTNMGMGSVLGNASLIKKVYVPKFIFPISRVVSSFVNLLFSLAAILLVMLITRSPFYWTILLVWAPLLLLLAFCCGMAVLLSALAGPLVNLICGAAFCMQRPSFAAYSLMLGIYNLLPVWPLDGGRMIRCVLLARLPITQAEHISEIVSFAACAVLLLIGVFLTFFRKSGLWPLGTAAYLTVRLLMLARRTDTVQ